MATYNKRIVEQIATLIEEGNHSISTICKITGISRKTFYDWKNTHPEFQAAIEDAEQRRTEELYQLASNALLKKVEGYYQTVSRTVYVPSADDLETLEIKQHVVTRKFQKPDTRLLLEILNRGSGKTKKKGLIKKNYNPALIVKRNEDKIQKDVNEIPPFTIKAKEVVEQSGLFTPQKENIAENAEIENQSINKQIEDKEDNEKILTKDTEKLKEKADEKIEKQKSSKYVQYASTYDPLPPGYTRRG